MFSKRLLHCLYHYFLIVIRKNLHVIRKWDCLYIMRVVHVSAVFDRNWMALMFTFITLSITDEIGRLSNQRGAWTETTTAAGAGAVNGISEQTQDADGGAAPEGTQGAWGESVITEGSPGAKGQGLRVTLINECTWSRHDFSMINCISFIRGDLI